ncbi:amidohydrolase family protein, partial [bacterium]|nr:amidohydrolase family protein [bacterium]
MSTLLIKNAALVATFDAQSRRIENCDILIKDNRISEIGQSLKAENIDRVIDAKDMLVMPGMVNCHHHLYQVLTRNVPRVQEAELFPWLVHLYEIWRELTPDALYWSNMAGLGELLLTGCTTTTDHSYLYPQNAPANFFDEQIKAAKALGIRFQPTRGSMSMGKDKGGLPPNDVVQDEETILRDCERVIKQYHDPDPLGMIKIALAPCSPFSVTPELLRESAVLARKYGVRCHTHLAETKDEDAFCLK